MALAASGDCSAPQQAFLVAAVCSSGEPQSHGCHHGAALGSTVHTLQRGLCSSSRAALRQNTDTTKALKGGHCQSVESGWVCWLLGC